MQNVGPSLTGRVSQRKVSDGADLCGTRARRLMPWVVGLQAAQTYHHLFVHCGRESCVVADRDRRVIVKILKLIISPERCPDPSFAKLAKSLGATTST